jgi:REP element-mobilizing transposase RayT
MKEGEHAGSPQRAGSTQGVSSPRRVGLLQQAGSPVQFAHTIMKYNPDIHHRRSIRLKGYDYSQCGYYFITICTKHRRCLFGEIENGQMILNNAGKMIDRWWNELKNKYANIEIDEYVVMPNHCHGIINIVGIVGADGIVGEDLCVFPDNKSGEELRMGEHAGSPQQMGRPIYKMIQWFKTMTTNEYIRNVKQNHWEPFDGKIWQRNYYEQIVRDEISLRRIREYIVNNPYQWQQDKLFAG